MSSDHLIYCSEGILVCPGIKWLGHEVDHICLVPRLRIIGFVPPPPPHVPYGMQRNIYFTVEEGHVGADGIKLFPDMTQ
jgi:hypothetical protein